MAFQRRAMRFRWESASVGQPNGGVMRPSPNGVVVARKLLKVYFFLPRARSGTDASFMSHGRSESPLIP